MPLEQGNTRLPVLVAAKIVLRLVQVTVT